MEWNVASFNEELYVIGEEDYWRNVQVYNLVLNGWRQGALMKFACAGHDVVLLEELIFVIAGHNGELYLNSSECFNPSTGQWAEISSMADVQRSAAAMAVDGKL